MYIYYSFRYHINPSSKRTRLVKGWGKMQKKPSGDQGNLGEGEGEKERVDILGEARDGGQGELGGESLVMMGCCVIVDGQL